MEAEHTRHEPAAAVVRDCRPDDLVAVQRIYAHYVLHGTATFEEVPPAQADWERKLGEIRDLGLPFLVAEAGGEVVGYTFCSRWRPRPAYRFTVEDSVYVTPGLLGRGIGGRLLDALLARCEAMGVRQVIAVIAIGDDPGSVALHERRGFGYAGRLVGVGFKFDRWIDTVLMQRSLGDDVE